MVNFYILGRLVEGSSSIRSSQSSSIPSTDSEYTNVDVMNDAEIEDYFEKMLVNKTIGKQFYDIYLYLYI